MAWCTKAVHSVFKSSTQKCQAVFQDFCKQKHILYIVDRKFLLLNKVSSTTFPDKNETWNIFIPYTNFQRKDWRKKLGYTKIFKQNILPAKYSDLWYTFSYAESWTAWTPVPAIHKKAANSGLPILSFYPLSTLDFFTMEGPRSSTHTTCMH